MTRPRPCARRRWRPAIFALAALLPAALAAQDTTSGVRIGLTYTAGTRPGVYVAPVAGAFADSVRAMLSRDLDYGDRVTAITPDGGDPLTGALNYPLYARLGAQAVVQASVTPSGSLHVALHDIAAAKVSMVGDFPLPQTPLSPEWRLAVHGVSDEVERWVTGTRGIAQSRILFVRDKGLWIVDSDGANAKPIGIGGSTAVTALSPAWHPSGRYVAYCEMGDQGTRIVMKDLQTGRSQRISARPGSNLTPAFSPDGNTLAFAAGDDGTDIFAVNPFTGEQPHRVTVSRGQQDSSPTFSPDGQHIAFTSNRLGHPEVYIVDADGANVEVLTSTGFGDQLYRSNPDWSPDGRRVAFQSQINGVFQVMTINARDRSVQALTSEGRNEDPTWAPDGRHIVFTSTRSGAKQLWVLDTETYRMRQLTRVGSARQGAWSPRLDNAK
ncbi:MAG: PD40 domain-containing protein [Gemmatimonadetes bacterium]|nr:PD40 domain-containing protein [Gemmatimonadota bacterium]MBI3566618.1 PD40 domain-containing protein [Gemmatimonadota bacterium]